MFKSPPSKGWLKGAVTVEDQFDISAGVEIQIGELIGVEPQKASAMTRLQMAFSILMHKLRIEQKLTLEQLADEIEVDCDHLLKIEKSVGFKPPPRTLQRLAVFYKLPVGALVQMAGAVTKIDPLLARNAVQFAAKSESFEHLNRDEKKLLDEFVKLVRDTQ
jgi:transcriptional regulator with XRE-family HTH domain